MKLTLPTRHFTPAVVFLGLLALWVPSSAEAQRDRGFTTPATLTNEVKHFVRLLEEVHYNRDSVKPRDYASVIPDFMGELDGQRLFFLGSDKEAFLGANPSDRLYWNITTLGKDRLRLRDLHALRRADADPHHLDFRRAAEAVRSIDHRDLRLRPVQGRVAGHPRGGR
jgi:hypothetical protein